MIIQKSGLRYRIISLVFSVLTLQYVLFSYIDEGTLTSILLYIIYFTCAILPFVLIKCQK